MAVWHAKRNATAKTRRYPRGSCGRFNATPDETEGEVEDTHARKDARMHARVETFGMDTTHFGFWGIRHFFPSRIQVLRVLLRRVPQHAAARVRGYRRFALEGRPYPAIVQEKDAQVIGKVLLDLTPSELRILDGQ